MERRPLGKTGLEVSVLGFGGAEIGYQSAALDTVERLLGSALDAGLNVIDTVECGAFDALQTSVSIADQEPITLTLPLALEKGMGVIAKRPLANVAWTKETMPEGEYAYPYFKRLQALAYDFLSGPDAASVALCFTLAQPGVSTAIVGTQNPDRWLANARLLDTGPLPAAQIEAIRARWNEVAGADWAGQR